MAKKALFTLAIVLISAAVFGQVRVYSALSQSVVMVGDTATLTVGVDYPDSVKIGFAIPQDSVLGGFAVLSVKLDTVRSQGNLRHAEIKYRLIYFSVGDNLIPPVGVVAHYPDGTADTILTQPIRVSFVPLIPDTAKIDSLQIRDIKPPRMVEIKYSEVARTLLYGFLIFLIALALIFLWHLKSRGISIAEFVAPKKPPWEVAFMELDALAESDLLERGEFKEYFDRLTDILRKYIEDRFGVAALELSTTETMENLRSASLDLDTLTETKFVDTTGELLQFADMVKFAKFIPQKEDALESWRRVRELIEMTIPKAPEESAGEAPPPPQESSHQRDSLGGQV